MTFEIVKDIDVLTFISGALSTVGAFFLVRSILRTSTRQLASMSSTYLGSNPHLQQSLVEQKADTFVGFLFTLVGDVFWVMCSHFRFTVPISLVASLGLLAGLAVIGVLGHFASVAFRKKLDRDTSLIVFAQHMQSALSHPKQFDAAREVEYAKKLRLGHLFEGVSDPYDCLKICVTKAGASRGAELIEDIRRDRKSKATGLP